MRETAQQTQLERYLLGELGDAEMEALEESFFTDSDAFLELQAAEMALVDRYVRSEISDAERGSFEANYLISAERKAKVDAARAFHNELSDLQPSVNADEPQLSWTERLRRALLLPTMQYAGAVLVLIMAASAGWLLLERGQTHNELLDARNSEQELNRQLNERQQELDRRVAEQRGEDSESLAALQNKIDELQKQLNDSKTKPINQNDTSQRQPLIATLILAAPRGGGAVPTINMANGTKVLNIKLPLAADQSAPFDIEISFGGKTIFKKAYDQLPIGNNPTVNISLPTSGVVDGQYAITVRDRKGEAKTYSFIVVRN